MSLCDGGAGLQLDNGQGGGAIAEMGGENRRFEKRGEKRGEKGVGENKERKCLSLISQYFSMLDPNRHHSPLLTHHSIQGGYGSEGY